MAVDTAASTDVDSGWPSTARMVWMQLRHANRGFWRAPVAAFFTIIFPLIFLLLLGTLIGDQPIEGSDVPVAQFLTPAIAAFAATTASFTSLAIGLVVDRELGVLKRIRGTPLTPSMFMAARVGSTVWIAFVSVVVMVAAGMVFFDVEIILRTLPAALLTLAVGISCFAALGLAVVGISPSQGATNAITNGILVPLAFISDVFVQQPLPDWLETIGWIFPLKHFANALADTFNPFLTGGQFGWDHLAVMAVWGVAGALVALRTFTWEQPTGGRARRTAERSAEAERPTARSARGDAAVDAGSATLNRTTEVGRPGVASLIMMQVTYATRAFVRSPASAFFTVAFPVVLLLLLPVVFGDQELGNRGGIRLTQFLAPVLAVYGAATAAYADFSQRVAFARDQGILKRIHGTPLPVWAFVTGRMLNAIIVAFASLVITVVVGMLVYGVELVPRALPGLFVTVVVGVGCFAALGLAIAAVVPDAETVPTVANATLLPLAFFSDIFLIGDLPAWMDTIGWVFPLKHFANAVADAVNTTIAGAGFFWDHLAVMALWLAAGLAVAIHFWTWEPRG